MATTSRGMYRPYAHARGATVGSFNFTLPAGAAANPTSIDDPGGFVQSVVYNGTGGQYLVTLKRRYSRIQGQATGVGTAEPLVNCGPIVAGGAAANTLLVFRTTGHNAGSVMSVLLIGYDS